MKQIEAGQSPYHFIEVMGCPGGCITGGGQPRSNDSNVREKRMQNLYDEDESKSIRKSHENPYIISFYEEYLGEPNGHLAHELLHTHYVKRGTYNELCNESFVIDYPKSTNHQRAIKSAHISDNSETSAIKHFRDELESVRVLNLEAENKKLKNELVDTLETVDILKIVISDYVHNK